MIHSTLIFQEKSYQAVFKNVFKHRDSSDLYTKH